MTIRSVIAKRKRKGILISYSGFVVILAEFVRAVVTHTRPVFVLLAIPLFIGGMLYSMFWVTCPNCNGNLGHIVMYSGGPFSLSKKFRFCPYCGVDLDSEVRPGEAGSEA